MVLLAILVEQQDAGGAMRRIACISTLLVSIGSAQAGAFLPDYQAWTSLSGDAKAGVVAGMADDLQNPVAEDQASRKAVGAGLAECFIRLQLKTGAMANAVESWYRADQRRQTAPVHIAFFAAIPGGLCKSFVDTELKRVGASTAL